MLIRKTDKKNKFVSMFNTDTGFYMRSGVLDENGKDTGVDPFMASFPELLDIGVMQTCVCAHRCKVDCYQNAITRCGANMSVEDYESIMKQCEGKLFQCLEENEIVLIRNGAGYVKSINIKDIRVGDYIYCGGNKFSKVIEKYERESDVYDIKLVYNRHIFATNEHRFPTNNGLKMVDELQERDILLDAKKDFNIPVIDQIDVIKTIIARKLDDEFFLSDCDGLDNVCKKYGIIRGSNKHSVRIDRIKDYLDELDYSNATVTKERSQYKCNAVYNITPELMNLLGHYIGNGGKRGITVNKEQTKMIDAIRHDIEVVFSDFSYNIRELEGAKRIEISSNMIYTMLFDKIFECRTLTNEKQLPNFIFSTSYENKMAFLKGYFCDGNFRVDKKDGLYGVVCFNTSSNKLYKDMCMLLASMNIGYRIYIGDGGQGYFQDRVIVRKQRYRIQISNLKEIFKIKDVVDDHRNSDKFYEITSTKHNENYLKDYQDNIIESITKLENTARVIDINIDSDDHLFITSHGIISHNCALGGAGDVDTHENFEELLKLTRKYGMVPNFTTSGIMMTPEKARLCKEYCGAVAVSEHNAEYTDRALDMLMDAGVKTSLHYVLGNNSIDEAICRLENGGFKQGINAVVFLLYKAVPPLGRSENVLKPDDPKVKRFFELVNKMNYHHKIGFDSCTCSGIINNTSSINLDSLDFCEGGRFSAYIDANMNMMPCSFANQDHSWHMSLKEHTIQEVWDSAMFDRFRYSLNHSCPGCPNRAMCGGGCPLMNEITLCNKEERNFVCCR